MATSLAGFRVGFPEFDRAPDPLVNAKMADAIARIDREVWGEQADSGTYNLTAHLLAISPFGMMAKLNTGPGTSTYGETYKEQRRSVTFGFGIT